MRVAFYAPLKAPDHPVPSGDRTMARALLEALRLAGHDVTQPSRLRSFLPAPDARRQSGIAAEARADIGRISREWNDDEPPEVWFTYHNHYKAPDLLGPDLARRFGLIYAVAEASHAAKRAAAWTSWQAATEAAIRAADLHVCFTARDREGLAGLLKAGSAVLDLPPFLDADADLPPAVICRSRIPRLVTLAMMRPGDKLASYRLLAEALALLAARPWHLDVIGDGPERAAVMTCFAAVLPPGRITWHGALDRAAAWRQVAAADVFVWPGFGEAFGLAYLEAQAAGVPVVALDTAGVNAVVRHGETGILVETPTAPAYAAALLQLMSDGDALARLGAAGRRFVGEERNLGTASAMLDQALRSAVSRRTCRHA